MNQQRTNFLSFSLLLCFLIIVIRLAYWQLIQGSNFRELVLRQSYQLTRVNPEPGLIFSQDNLPLVLNQHFYSLSVYKPDLQVNPDELFNNIDKIIPDFTTKYQSQIEKFEQNPKIKWQTFNAGLTYNQKNKLNLSGLTFQPQITRVYPEGSSDYLIGLEKYYRRELNGRAGFSLESKNAVGEATLTKKTWSVFPKNGSHLHTTINREIQYLAQKSLQDGTVRYSADSGSIIIMEPQKAAILAMSDFTPSQASDSTQLIPNISELFEPGSIFKPLVVAMALEHGTIDTDYFISQCSQPHTIGDYTITNWDNLLHPNSSLRDIIKNSDNIGMSFIISRLGKNNFLTYFHSLKLDDQTDIDLPGEAKPLVKNYWPEIDLATASFGQGFATTQINMLTSFNVLANQGYLVRPHLVNSIKYQGNIDTTKYPPPKSVFKPDTVNKVIDILKYAVNNGAVSRFNVRRLEVCGKSGTAQVALGGHYTDTDTIASYIGFSPCYHPKFTMIVTIRNPKTSPWGSSTAAPIWFEIAAKISPLL